MVFYKIKRTALLLAILLISLSGCARRMPASLDQLSINRRPSALVDSKLADTTYERTGQKVTRSFTPFEEIVVSLVVDSLDLLPGDISSSIYDVILKGIEIPEQYDVIDKSIIFSSKKEDIAMIAGHIVQLVYGENIGSEIIIPQSILYFHKDKVANTDMSKIKSRLSSSENRNLDAYDTCLSLLVNSLAGNYGILQQSREGLYLRDSKNNLYFYKDVKFLGNKSN